MTNTLNLNISLLEASQAQKEVTANEAFVRIDAIHNCGAIDKDVATPPVSPAAGDLYIIAASPTGDWSGKAKQIAYYEQVWRFIVPKEGMTLWVKDEDKHYTYNGSDWIISHLNHNEITDFKYFDIGDKNTAFTVLKEDGFYQRVRLTGNISTLTLPALPATGKGFKMNLEIVQDGVGTRSITSWAISGGGTIIWQAGVKTLSTSANITDIAELRFTPSGVRISLLKAFVV